MASLDLPFFSPDDTDKFHAVSDQLRAVTRTRPFDPQLAHTWGATLFRRLKALPVFPPSRAAKALRRERGERTSERAREVRVLVGGFLKHPPFELDST